MNLFVLSELRPGSISHVGWSASHSLEETLKELLNPTFIYPKRNENFGILEKLGIEEDSARLLERGLSGLNRVFKTWYGIQTLPTLPQGTNVLLAIGMTPNFLLSLHSLGPLLKQFDLRVAYLLDGFAPEWIDQSIVPYIDHLFVITNELAEEVQKTCGISTTFLPLATDTTKSNFPSSSRWIDIISYGRGNQEVHKCLQTHFNQQANKRIYFHSTFRNGELDNRQEHVDLMWKLLSRSKISLCFEASNIPRFRGQSPLLYRWFEAWAAGCTVVGKRPFGQGVAELMDWENSTIEIPDSPADWIPFFEALLEDETTLALNAQRNYQECVLRHDWRYRIKDILETIEVPIPDALSCSITQLKKQVIRPADFFEPLNLAAVIPKVASI